VDDLRLQLRELTNANLDLRAQMKDQSDTIEKLKAEFEELRNERKPAPLKPPSGPKLSGKQAAP
jgi:predicted RNase H-like nuclease (RuvC/YqgF family)